MRKGDKILNVILITFRVIMLTIMWEVSH